MSTYEAIRYNFTGANIPSLNGSNIASGTVAEARVADLPTSKITSGTFADARLSSGSVTQHVDLTALSASNLTSGTIPNDRYGSPTFNGSNLTSLPSSAPSSATAIGSHGLGMHYNYSGGFSASPGGTTSNFRFINVHGNHGSGGNASGTWRRHGSHSSGNNNERSTVYCRIS
tara:strand:+ start:23 stop:541 length:519 start_codon:yes stop_codon:yes gene_type:complete